jgi:hypothetical protein
MTKQELDRWYRTAEWTNFRAYVIRKNSLCQFVDEDGKRCLEASRVVHHLISPLDDWNRRTDWANVTAVCARHHQGGQRGETQGYRYAPTVGPDLGYGVESEVYVHLPNEVVPTGKEGKQYTSVTLKPGMVTALLDGVVDVTFEEACDLAETSYARMCVHNGRRDLVSREALAELKRCQQKYGRDREGWAL